MDLPALEIPADFFLVHFHSDGSNNDYGFRLIAEGRHPVLSERPLGDAGTASVDNDNGDDRQPHGCADVGPWPLYLGQPPPHASPRRTIHGGLLAEVRAWNRPLLVKEVAAIAAEPPPAARAEIAGIPDPRPESESTESIAEHERDEESVGSNQGLRAGGEHPERASAVQVLALAHACCRAEFGRKAFSNAPTVRALLRLVLQGGVEKRGLALRVCRAMLAWVEPRVVDHEFR